MGAKPVIDCPRGVTIRTFPNETRIQIAFTFSKTECKELMPPCAVTKAAIAHASGLRFEIQRKIAAGTFLYSDYFPDSAKAKQFGPAGDRVLIGTLLEAQLGIYEKQAADGNLSPSTLAGYRKAIKSKRMKHWEDKTLGAATQPVLREWIAGLGLITAKSSRNLLTPLRSVLEDAQNARLIKTNPFSELDLSKLLKQTSKSSEYVVDPFTADERAAIIGAAREDEWPMIQFWFACGLRQGEMIALKWPKIDFQAAVARVDLNQVEGVEKEPKTRAGIRDVNLNSDAIAALNAQKAKSMAKGQHVWLNPASGEPWTTDAQIRKTLWVPLMKRAGIKYRNPYQMRHTCASAQLTAGANPWYLAEQLGHEDPTMIFKIYGRFIAKDFQKPKVALRVVGQ